MGIFVREIQPGFGGPGEVEPKKLLKRIDKFYYKSTAQVGCWR